MVWKPCWLEADFKTAQCPEAGGEPLGRAPRGGLAPHACSRSPAPQGTVESDIGSVSGDSGVQAFVGIVLILGVCCDSQAAP